MAIAAPILLGTAWVVSNMETNSAAAGEPNGLGGQHYRITDNRGAKALPEALAALVAIPEGMAMTDVNADTDASGRLASAVIKGFSAQDFKTISAFYKPTLNPVTADGRTELSGLRNGYDIRISQERREIDDPYPDRNRIEYYIKRPKN